MVFSLEAKLNNQAADAVWRQDVAVQGRHIADLGYEQLPATDPGSGVIHRWRRRNKSAADCKKFRRRVALTPYGRRRVKGGHYPRPRPDAGPIAIGSHPFGHRRAGGRSTGGTPAIGHHAAACLSALRRALVPRPTAGCADAWSVQRTLIDAKRRALVSV